MGRAQMTRAGSKGNAKDGLEIQIPQRKRAGLPCRHESQGQLQYLKSPLSGAVGPVQCDHGDTLQLNVRWSFPKVSVMQRWNG